MARSKSRIPLHVFLNGRMVGVLRRQSSGAIDFQYDPSWLSWKHTMPVSLSLPLREDRYIGDPVVAVFDNLLPDNDQLRRRLAQKARAEGHDTFNLLAAIGRDCVGALQFLPEGESPGPVGRIESRRITEKEIAKILADLKRTPLGISVEDDFRISIAGAQEKTALLFWKGNWHLPQGSTPTTHILKPEIGILENGLDLSQSVENEHLCMRLAQAFGLPVATTRIEVFEGKQVLIVERFDRRWTTDRRLLRLPQEDFCQALSMPSTLKYESDGGPGIKSILEFLKGSDEPDTDQRIFLKAQIVYWLLAATDGHAKNFSIGIAPGGRFRLAPLYDVMSAQTNLDAKRIRRSKMKLAMAVGRRRHYVIDSILPRHFIQTGELSGLSGRMVEEIMDELREQVPGAIDRTLKELPRNFPAKLVDSIVGGVQNRLRLSDRK
ncbi:MAG: type II toxin-antitoxin system HipA family toxin [Pseudomonadota bacterium]